MTEDTSLREKALRDEHERIWLEPFGAPDRCWCQDNVWGDEAVEYVRADIADATRLRIEALEAALTELAEYVDGYHFASERGRVARLVFSARAALSGKEGQS